MNTPPTEEELRLAYAEVESSSEHRRAPKRQPHHKRKQPCPPTVTPPEVEGFAAAASEERPSKRVEPMGNLIRAFPHLDAAYATSACEVGASKLATVAGPKTPTVRTAAAVTAEPELALVSHLEASRDVPVALLQLAHDKRQLAVPTGIVAGQLGTLTATEATGLLRSGQVSLPMYTAAHESAMLVQAGQCWIRGHSFSFPPCARGRDCMGMTQRIRGLDEPIILMRAMSPTELKALMTTGEQPVGSAPCVLCHRHTVASYVHHYRLLQDAVIAHPGSDLVYQLWSNTYDRAGGYYKEYTVLPRVGEIVMGPLCESTYWGLRAYQFPDAYHEGGSRRFWCIDQSAMVWQAPPARTPEVGEMLPHF